MTASSLSLPSLSPNSSVPVGDVPLTFREFAMAERAPLSDIVREVFQFLRENKEHVVLFGAHAVNLYATPPRMTEDVDVMTDLDAERVAEEIKSRLSKRFHIAVRVRRATDVGFRVYQLQEPKNRHLVDVRSMNEDVAVREVSGVRVVEIADLVAMKVASYSSRSNKPKGLTDRVDLERLLNSHPELRQVGAAVEDALVRLGHPGLIGAWQSILSNPLELDDDE